jgi:hypothetical protein
VSVNWCVVVCCGVVRWVPIETELQVKDHLLLQTGVKCVRDFRLSLYLL